MSKKRKLKTKHSAKPDNRQVKTKRVGDAYQMTVLRSQGGQQIGKNNLANLAFGRVGLNVFCCCCCCFFHWQKIKHCSESGNRQVKKKRLVVHAKWVWNKRIACTGGTPCCFQQINDKIQARSTQSLQTKLRTKIKRDHPCHFKQARVTNSSEVAASKLTASERTRDHPGSSKQISNKFKQGHPQSLETNS